MGAFSLIVVINLLNRYCLVLNNYKMSSSSESGGNRGLKILGFVGKTDRYRNPEWDKYPCKQEMDDYLCCLGERKSVEELQGCSVLAKAHLACKEKHGVPRTNQIR